MGRFALLIWFVGPSEGRPEPDDARLDEWGRAISDALLRAWKPGYSAAFLPRPGDAISSRTVGEAVTSHMTRPMVVSAVLHSPVLGGDESHDQGRPVVFVEIRQEIERVDPNLVSALMKGGWHVL